MIRLRAAPVPVDEGCCRCRQYGVSGVLYRQRGAVFNLHHLDRFMYSDRFMYTLYDSVV